MTHWSRYETDRLRSLALSGRTRNMVIGKARREGIALATQAPPWTPYEVDALRSGAADGLTASQLSRAIGRPLPALRVKLRKLGISLIAARRALEPAP